MFNVIDTETGIVIRTFDDGASASVYMREENAAFATANSTTRYRIVKQNWKEREQGRFISGQYVPTPWHGIHWDITEHYCHVAIKDGARLAYTPSEEHGVADRQVVVDAGAYLKRYYSEQGEDWIEGMLREFRYRNEPELLFARTSDEIEEVYTKSGIDSCMSKPARWYSSSVHPVRVYGSGDFAVAYLRDADGDISARGIVCEDRKIFSRLYGDAGHISQALRNVGFRKGSYSEAWTGLRLLRIQEDDGFVVPYLDGPIDTVTDNGKHLVVDESGEIQCNNTNGMSELQGFHCEYCGNRCNGDEMSVGGETWCESCYGNYSFYCSSCSESYHTDNCAGHDRHDEAICDDCARDGYTRCHECNVLEDDSSISTTMEGNAYCRTCADDLEVTTCGELAENAADCECTECEHARNEEETV